MQEISSSLHYAVEMFSIMSLLAGDEPEDTRKHQRRPISLREVVTLNSEMSINFLEQIARKLRIAGILEVVRGPGGGYLINKAFHDITIGEILDADILRNPNRAKKKTPNFKTKDALQDIYLEQINKFRDTKLTNIEGFGKK